MKRKIIAVAVATWLAIGTAVGVCAKGEAATVSNIGVYHGTANVNGVENWGKWLGRTGIWATDYLDPADSQNGWTQSAAKKWGAWKWQAPGRNVVFGLPLTPKVGARDLASTAAGKNDKLYQDTGKQLVAAGLGNAVIRLGYEGNNAGIGSWAGTNEPSTYRAAFVRAVTALRSAKGQSFKIDLTFAVGNAGKVSNFYDLYPGGQYVDFVGLDVYDVWWGAPGVTNSSRWQNTWNRQMGIGDFLRFAANVGKRITFPEWGLYKPGDQYAGGGDSPYFIDRMADLFMAVNAVYQSYFNVDWGGGTIVDFPQGQDRYKERFGV